MATKGVPRQIEGIAQGAQAGERVRAGRRNFMGGRRSSRGHGKPQSPSIGLQIGRPTKLAIRIFTESRRFHTDERYFLTDR